MAQPVIADTEPLALRPQAPKAAKIARSSTASEASSTAIQAMIRELVGKENPRKPLSDAKLTQQLNDAGIHVARRTVAKYREALGIPSSHERVRMG